MEMLDGVKDRILRDAGERAKLREEVAAVAREKGIEQLIPMKGQDEFRQLADLRNEGQSFAEDFAKDSEAKAAKRLAERKAHLEETAAHAREIWLRRREQSARRAYDARRIVL